VRSQSSPVIHAINTEQTFEVSIGSGYFAHAFGGTNLRIQYKRRQGFFIAMVLPNNRPENCLFARTPARLPA
jgi:hypothetical protein